jgi:hypothetical protein
MPTEETDPDPRTEPLARYLRLGKAATRYGVSVQLLRKMIRQGILKPVRPQGVRMVLLAVADLDFWFGIGK